MGAEKRRRKRKRGEKSGGLRLSGGPVVIFRATMTAKPHANATDCLPADLACTYVGVLYTSNGPQGRGRGGGHEPGECQV